MMGTVQQAVPSTDSVCAEFQQVTSISGCYRVLLEWGLGFVEVMPLLVKKDSVHSSRL